MSTRKRARFGIHKRSHKAGLSPGILLPTGEQKRGPVHVEMIRYDRNGSVESEIRPESALPGAPVSWYNIDGVHDVEALSTIGKNFHLHPLTMEDILNTDQRPKLEEYEEYLFIVMKMIRLDDSSELLLAEQLSLILCEDAVVSFQEGIEGDVFDSVRARIEGGKGRMRAMGPDYLCYALIDSVVDNYFVILETLGERIEVIEEEALNRPSPKTLQSIHHFKRELVYLRRSVWPLREVISGLLRMESPLLNKTTRVFLRDVYDHTIQIIDTVEIYRDVIGGMIDLYMSALSHRMNEVMKVLTIIATVFIPLTFIAGVYGMNFEFMPELRWPWGYAFAWAVMLLTAGALFLYFHRKGWLRSES